MSNLPKWDKIPEWLILRIWHALIGEIYPEIRAIVLSFNDRDLLLRYYFDREPTEEDMENIGRVITKIRQNSSGGEIRSIEKEAILLNGKVADMDILDFPVYSRQEYSEC